MSQQFSQLTARYFQSLAAELLHGPTEVLSPEDVKSDEGAIDGPVSAGQPTAPDQVAAEKRADPTTTDQPPVIDAKEAEQVGDGTFVFFEDKLTEATGWWVFFRSAAWKTGTPAIFTLRGEIKIAGSTSAFVGDAYRYVLNREADAPGLAAYVGHLTSGTLTRRDLLRILATSTECASLGDRLLIVPAPSQTFLEADMAMAKRHGAIELVQSSNG